MSGVRAKRTGSAWAADVRDSARAAAKNDVRLIGVAPEIGGGWWAETPFIVTDERGDGKDSRPRFRASFRARIAQTESASYSEISLRIVHSTVYDDSVQESTSCQPTASPSSA